MRKITTDKTQGDSDRLRYEKFLQNQGSLSGIIMDRADEFELLQANTGTGAQCYEDFGKILESLMSKIVLGHGSALDSVPGKLGKESSVEDAISEVKMEDGRYIAWVCKSILFPKLRYLGVPIPEGFKLVYGNDDELLEGQTKEAENALIFSQALNQLSQAGYKVDVSDVAERLDMNVVVSVAPDNTNAPDDTFARAKAIQDRINLIYFKRHGKNIY
jgi:hypothetical protein